MKKRILSLLLATVMVLSLVACGNKTTGNQTSESTKTESKTESKEESKEESKVEAPAEPVLLRIFFRANAGTDDAKLSAYISELPSVKELGVEIEITRLPGGEYNEKIPLMIASNEQMDIMMDDGDNFWNRMVQGAHTDLSAYLAADDTLYNQIPEEMWAGSKLDGAVYGVPSWKDNGIQWAMFVPTSLVEETGVDITTIKKLTDVEPLLAASTAVENGYGLRVFGASKGREMLNYELFGQYDLFSSNMVAIDREEATTFVNTFETEEFKNLCAVTKTWQEKGYITKDVLSRTTNDGFSNHGVGLVGYAPLYEISYGKSVGEDITVIPASPAVKEGIFRQFNLCVLKKSENPELAFKFIQLMNTDPDVKNAFTYGIPGDHYNLVDGQVEKTEGVNDRWNLANYMSGDMRNSYTMVGEPEDKWDVYQAFNDNAVKSATDGMSFDITPVNDQIANCKVVISEHLTPLMYGLVDDYEAGIETFVKQLKAAGIDEVIAEYQKQFDAQK